MARVDRTERLLNLVFALMAGSRPVTRADIQAAVPGYDSEQSVAAFERMFERDKDELRSMGVPIQTVLSPDGEVDGYRISREDYALDALSFTAAELAVLALAASVWDHALLGPAAVTALRKIEAAQGGSASRALQGMRVQASASDGALLPLMRALREGTVVTFDYRASGAEVTRREVDPWRLVSHQGHWYLAAFDHHRQALRVFRLSRILGAVTVTARAQQHPFDGSVDVEALLRGEPADPAETARIEVAAGQAASLRRLSTTPLDPFAEGEIEVPLLTGQRLTAAVCAAGAGAVVLAPPSLRDDVVAGLERVAVLHG